MDKNCIFSLVSRIPQGHSVSMPCKQKSVNRNQLNESYGFVLKVRVLNVIERKPLIKNTTHVLLIFLMVMWLLLCFIPCHQMHMDQLPKVLSHMNTNESRVGKVRLKSQLRACQEQLKNNVLCMSSAFVSGLQYFDLYC